jgi:hypothetical protein
VGEGTLAGDRRHAGNRTLAMGDGRWAMGGERQQLDAREHGAEVDCGLPLALGWPASQGWVGDSSARRAATIPDVECAGGEDMLRVSRQMRPPLSMFGW